MTEAFAIKRTTTAHADFQLLVTHLDNELWNELKEDQAQYDQYNKVPDIKTAVILYGANIPIAIGCFKAFDENTVEVKRMFVEKTYRGKGCSKQILNELEKWAVEAGYSHAVLETSIHFIAARSLYTKAGYAIIPNYGQYAGLEESVCMKKDLRKASEFKSLSGIEYFDFEEDFVEENVRCIPMIVRFKMDAAGIKLKLAEWSKFKVDERIALAVNPAATTEEAGEYNNYLSGLIKKYTAADATVLALEAQPAWSVLNSIPAMLQDKATECGWEITITQWQQLTNLQRFALLKLCRPGHENKNFPKAMKEFGLLIAG
jgi:hypothetical protein